MHTFQEYDKIIWISLEKQVMCMIGNMENLKIVLSLRRPGKQYVRVEKRKTHSFFVRVKGSVLYRFPEKEFVAREGNIVFIPKGSCYEAQALAEDPMYMAIHFEGDFAEPPEPMVFPLEGFPDGEYMTRCFADLWNFGTQAERYKCLSLFYNLLSYLSALESSGSSENGKDALIAPAVAHLKAHLYDCDLRADRLHRLCGISGTYFRELFAARFGMTPHSYILSRRLSHAMSIIRSGDFNTIGEVANACGFSDPLYFSKVFKKAYGMPPSDLRKI